MAHSHEKHNEHHKSRSRAKHVLKSAGDHHPHAVADKGMLSHSFREHEGHPHKVAGYQRGGRIAKYARGGKADKKHHTQVNIAVVSPHGKDAGPGAGAAPGAPPPMGARPPIAPPPGGMPPGLPPGMAPPGGPPGPMPPGAMPPRPPMRRGGRVKRASGGAVTQMKPVPFDKFKPAGGMDSGEGRLSLHKHQAKFSKKPRK